MKLLICLLLSILPSALKAQDTTNTKERINVEMAIQIKSTYTAYSLSIEKEFQYNQFYFGPRIEVENPIGNQQYRPDPDNKDSQYVYRALLNIRLVQIEYQVNPYLRIGIAPVWMQGPLPRKGWYRTPTSLYAHFWLDRTRSLQLIAQANTHLPNPVQLELRKRF